ncbi:hypothetical protein [Waddlia chondrophila]|uniref:Uncharacterized protein n=1 Tax=Waddlia chondrophila (strain ATCC VR-1470 / WSU 86-1044) TaxID=716544 RepID=D6YTF2_WADCW|nr:hypothetical protein [Waddlia chondrophila]ADI37413.1 conserved hypothetical protein [Waddlia chondrophila WSU 86-1044]
MPKQIQEMMKNLLPLLLIFAVSFNLEGASPPASFTFMIADLKHNDEEGIKICELQAGSLSAFRGYDWLTGEPGAVSKKVMKMLNQFGHSLWVLSGSISDPSIQKEMKTQKVNVTKNLSELYKNKTFIQQANLPVKDPYDLSSYPVLLIASPKRFQNNLESFQEQFPNVLILDLPSYPYWKNKYEMSLLLRETPELEQIKPHWELFSRAMTSEEIQSSHTHFSSEYVVIKPLNAFLGNGVILLERTKLPEILQLIWKSPKKLPDSSDKGYSYWKKARDKHLIVEEFHLSDPVAVSHLKGKEYDPTLRVVFMLWHEHGEIQMDFVELHWKLPKKSLSEKGSFSEKHKSYGQIPHFALVEPEREEAIKHQLRETMPLLYAKMLGWEDLNHD